MSQPDKKFKSALNHGNHEGEHVKFDEKKIEPGHDDNTGERGTVLCKMEEDGTLDVPLGWLRTNEMYKFCFFAPLKNGKLPSFAGDKDVLTATIEEADGQALVSCEFRSPAKDGEYKHLMSMKYPDDSLFRAFFTGHCLARKQGTPGLKAGVHAMHKSGLFEDTDQSTEDAKK